MFALMLDAAKRYLLMVIYGVTSGYKGTAMGAFDHCLTLLFGAFFGRSFAI